MAGVHGRGRIATQEGADGGGGGDDDGTAGDPGAEANSGGREVMEDDGDVEAEVTVGT